MKKFYLPAVILLALTSCKKEVSGNEQTCELSAANVPGTYKVVSVIYKKNATSAGQNVFESYSACEKDDIFVLNANNTVEFKDTGIACNPPVTYSSNWSLAGDTITIDSHPFVVKSFNCTGFVAELKGTESGESYTSTFAKN